MHYVPTSQLFNYVKTKDYLATNACCCTKWRKTHPFSSAAFQKSGNRSRSSEKLSLLNGLFIINSSNQVSQNTPANKPESKVYAACNKGAATPGS